MDIESNLKNLSHASAILLLKRIYGFYGDIDDIIENHIAAYCVDESGDDELYQSLQRQLKQVEVEDSYVGYYEAANFCCRLQSLLIDIDTLLRKQNPARALDLLSRFLNMVEPVMERVDDSGGDIGGVFDQAIDQWLDTAAENSMAENDSLFEVFDVGGEKAFGTTSTATNIHSHYVGAGSAGFADYQYSGRMMMASSYSGIGITFFSDYPITDTYYRLRSNNNSNFHIAPHPHGKKA